MSSPPWPPAAGPQKTSGLAVATLIFGIIGAVPIALILGVIALVRIASKGQRGRGLAVSGLVLSLLWTGGIAAAIYLLRPTEPERDAQGQITTPQSARPESLRVGDCVAKMKEGEILNVQAQPCSKPNGGKVYAVFNLTAGSWPGTAALDTTVQKECETRHKALKQPASKSAEFWSIQPTEDSWKLGDRRVVCLVVAAPS